MQPKSKAELRADKKAEQKAEKQRKADAAQNAANVAARGDAPQTAADEPDIVTQSSELSDSAAVAPSSGGTFGQTNLPSRPAQGEASEDSRKKPAQAAAPEGPVVLPIPNKKQASALLTQAEVKVKSGIYQETKKAPSVDPALQVLEDKLVPKTKGQKFGFDGHPEQEVLGRVGYGTIAGPKRPGKPVAYATRVELRANYLEITQDPAVKSLHQYSVTVHKRVGERLAEQSKAHKKLAFNNILQLLQSNSAAIATDYSTILIASAKLVLLGEEIDYMEYDEPVQPPGNNSSDFLSSGNLCFEIKYERELSLQAMIDSLKSPTATDSYAHGPSLIQAMNIIMAKAPRENSNHINVVGSNKFFPRIESGLAGHLDLTGGLRAFRGFFSSVRPATGRLLLNLNVTSSAFYNDGISLDELMRQASGSLAGLSNSEKTSFYKHLRVRVRYVATLPTGLQQNVDRERTIHEITDHLAQNISFDWKQADGTTLRITVAEYYQRQHRLPVRDQTLVDVGSAQRHEWIPLGLCEVVSRGQPYRRVLNSDMSKTMIGFAARRPNQNAMSIAGDNNGTQGAEGLKALGLLRQSWHPAGLDPQQATVNRFGFKVGTELIKIQGRRLFAPKVAYTASAFTPSNGSWNLIDSNKDNNKRPQKLIKSGKIESLAVLILEEPSKDPTVRQEIRNNTAAAVPILLDMLRSCGITVPGTVRPSTQLLEALVEAKRTSNEAKILAALKGVAKPSLKPIVLVVLPKQDRWLYACIKRLADTELGIHTVCCVSERFRQGKPSYMANLALKFNVKSDGFNHSVVDLWPDKFDNGKSTMLVGIDVTHPSPGSAEDAPSIASMVASVGADLTQWPGSLRQRASGKEIQPVDESDQSNQTPQVRDLTVMIKERLRRWLDERKSRSQQYSLPSRIVVFRDGVSEGQYHQVLELEYQDLLAGCQEAYGAAHQAMPLMTIIVVGKRHHTRFYPIDKKDAAIVPPSKEAPDDWNYNPLCGTIVDRGITNRIYHEYYLQAHHGLKGSARPAHYVVLMDGNALSADEIQDFTHKLSYLYNRATKAVSICPPAYYADLLADRGRLYLHGTMNEGAARTTFTGPGGDRMIHPDLQSTTFYI